MTKTVIALRVGAFIILIPALVLMANFVCYAFSGSGFLPVGDSDMNAARAAVLWFSVVLPIWMVMASLT